MLTKDIIRELRSTIEKNKGKTIGFGETKVDLMARDCLETILELQAELDRLKQPKLLRTNGDRIRAMTNEELGKWIFEEVEYADLPPWWSEGYEYNKLDWTRGWQDWLDAPIDKAGNI